MGPPRDAFDDEIRGHLALSVKVLSGDVRPARDAKHGTLRWRLWQGFGVLKLTLHAKSYDWEFIPEAGKTYADSGTGSCH